MNTATRDVGWWSTLGLGFIVLLIYSTLWSVSNRISGMEPERYRMWFDFERHVPFVPAAVPVYVSFDLVAIIYPMTYANWRKALPLLTTLLGQLVIAIPFFLLLPMEPGFEGNHPTGIWGDLCRWAGIPDVGTWNHVPSLHVSGAFTIAAALWLRWGRVAGSFGLVWATAVMVSCWLVHEHYLVDIAGGLPLAGFTIPLVLVKLQASDAPGQWAR